jgi:Domain of unknown function (DUF4326)
MPTEFDRLCDRVERADLVRQPHRFSCAGPKGWRMPPNTIKVDSSTRWGNPFHVGGDSRAECVARFAHLLAGECASEAEEAWRAGAWRTATTSGARTWRAGAP